LIYCFGKCTIKPAGRAQVVAEELLKEAIECLNALEKGLAAWEIQRLLSGCFDTGAAVLTIQAGAGGDDAMDWAEMLERMYLRWFEARKWHVQEIDRVVGEVAGIKSADYEVHGRFAFGLLYAEKGTHRLVRQSPFNAKHARQTSFAAVDIAPLLNEVCRPHLVGGTHRLLSSPLTGGSELNTGASCSFVDMHVARQPQCHTC
jgi:protein subunit release factor A